MKIWCPIVLCLWLLSCTTRTSTAVGNPTEGNTTHAGTEAWRAVMQDLDAACIDLDQWLLQSPRGDLVAVASRARAAAARIQLGYGALDMPHIDGFARLSRDCESWFLQIAMEAQQCLRITTADLYRTGREQHCARCHDAFEANK